MRSVPIAIALTSGVFGFIGVAAPAIADGYATRGIAVAPTTWSGFYGGINGGYGFAADDEAVIINETFNAAPFFGPSNHGSLDIRGGFGGVQLGVNHQMGTWVIGLEADFQGADISDRSSGSAPYLAGTLATATTKNTVRTFGTVRPRFGFTWDRTLMYATAGVAWGEVDHEMRWSDTFGFSATDKSSVSRFGYVVGGGIEHKFTSRLSFKVEYQYIDLGSMRTNAHEVFGPAQAATAFANNTNTHTDFHTVRAGLNYQFYGRPEVASIKDSAPAPRHDWSGLYFGVHSGWAWSETNANYPDTIIPALSISGVRGAGWETKTDAPILGGQIGLQHQFGQIVLGAEASLGSTLQNKYGEDICPKQAIAIFTCNSRLDDLATVGGRLGLSMGHFMPYVAGGYASARFNEQVTNRSLAPVGFTIINWGQGRDSGWYIGGGVDWLISGGWTVGVDYKHLDFGSGTKEGSAIIGGTWGPLPNDTARFENTADILSLRVSWKLGRPEATPLK